MCKDKINAFNQMLRYCEAQIIAIKKDVPEKNTPRQITNGGKLLAYNKIKVKLKRLISIQEKLLNS